MGHLKISEPLLIGHAEIDKEHKQLAALINKGIRAVDNGALETCAGTLNKIVEILEQHFVNEERIMSGLGFPGRSAHAKLHRTCMKKVHRLQRQCLNPVCQGEDCVLKILSIVLEDLIKADLDFKSYLQSIDYKA